MSLEYKLDILYNDYPLLKYKRESYYNKTRKITNEIIELEKEGIYDNFDIMGYKCIDKIINEIKDKITENDIFYDLGSGMGNVITHFYYDTLCKKLVGIEYYNELYEISLIIKNKINISKSREICYYQENLCKTDISEATIIYFGILNNKGSKANNDDILIDTVTKKINGSKNIRVVVSLVKLDIKYKHFKEIQCVPNNRYGKITEMYPFLHYFYYI